MVSTVGVFLYLCCMQVRTEIPKGETEFCILCARDHGEMIPATCRMYSFGYGVRIPVCCACCEEQLQAKASSMPFTIFLN